MSLSTDYSTSASQANHNKINAEDINLQHINADARAVLDFGLMKTTSLTGLRKTTILISVLSQSLAKFGKQLYMVSALTGSAVTIKPTPIAPLPISPDAWRLLS